MSTIKNTPTPLPEEASSSQAMVTATALAEAEAATLEAGAPTGTELANAAQAKQSVIASEELQSILSKAGLQRTASGAIADVSQVGELTGAEKIYGTGETSLPPAAPPALELSPELQVGAVTFATNLDTALNNYLTTKTQEGQVPVSASTMNGSAEGTWFKDLSSLSADDLLAAFLKVNITDPNNNVETHNKLHAVATDMRHLAIHEAKKKIENAQEARKEAEQYAQQAEYISNIITVVSIVASVFTFGASLAATAGATVAKEGIMAGIREALKQAVNNIVQA
ncbi:MAG: hypothetical protein AAFX94_22380, partial [Myxococcota bacterium]